MLKKEDLIKGEIYTHTNGCVFRYYQSNDSHCDGDIVIGDFGKSFKKKICGTFTISQIKKATPEECHWLLECEKANKFISKNEALKTFDVDYTGRYIKALVDKPSGGRVKKGEIGRFIDNGQNADFPSHKNYSCGSWKTTKSDTYELLPKDYEPEPEPVPREKPKFEEGKYYYFESYKDKYPNIVKLLRVNTSFETDNWIMLQNKKYSGYGSWSLKSMYNIRECTLEEIQQYLPDNHADLEKYLP